MSTRRETVPCIETASDDRKVHAWQSTGLDVVADELSSTRRCVWCGRREHKRYGAGGSRGWKVDA